MKVVVAPNAFKGSLSAFEAAAAIARGARRAAADVEARELPIADGGDGTSEVVCRARGGTFHEVTAVDALGRPCSGRFGRLADGTAVLDVATVSGLAQLGNDERRPLAATSYGTGQLLRAALAAGAKRVVLGVGGSATVDAGAGILRALGARLVDERGHDLEPGGRALSRLYRVDVSELDPRALTVPIDVACDVDNPLIGPDGAARIFGPQKGATPEMVDELEGALAHAAAVLRRDFGRDVAGVPSGGAAGGIAAGLHAVLGARLLSGIELVLDLLDFDHALEGARLCVTGEGRFDGQSLRNKGPLGAARRARARGVPVVVIAGDIAEELAASPPPELTAMFSLHSPSVSLERAKREARPLLEQTAERAVRLALAR